jgi:hypothetical protein
MRKRAHTIFHSQVPHPPSGPGTLFANSRELLGVLLGVGLCLAMVGLSSCAGYTSASSSHGGDPGGVLSPSLASVNFGNVAVGSTSSQSLTVTNTGTATVDISQATITGTGFTIVGGNPSSTIPVGQSSTVQVQFAPQSASTVNGSLTITSDASNSPLAIALTGTGTQGGLSFSPGNVNFGSVVVGQSGTQTVKLTNSGNTSVTVNLAQISGSGYAMSGFTTPTTLTAGQSASVNVQFSPTATGGSVGGIVFTDNAPGSPQSVTLTGSGISANSTLTANPGSVAFGSVTVGSDGSQTITLTNSGGTSVTISQASISGTGFSMTGLTAPLTLSSGENTGFVTRFTPTAAGNSSGTITITSNATDSTLSIALSGTGAQGKLSANPASVNFGSILAGASASIPVTLTNTGTANVTISAASASGTGFSISGLTVPQTIDPNMSASFTAKFAPTVAGTDSGSVSITSNAPGSPLVIALSGTATANQPQLTISPASVSFGNVNVGSNTTQNITLTNSGNATLTISAASASGTGFSISGLTLPANITAGNSATLVAKFAPSASGAASGSISITSNAPGSPAGIALSGTGVAATYLLGASPASISFGSETDGTGISQNVTLTNSGNSNVTVSSVSVSGAGFSASGVNSGSVIAPGKTATLTVTFDPSTAGAATGTVTVASNATNSPAAISVSGTGVQSSSVTLNWDASTSSGVTGYNVYRGTAPDTYSRIASSVSGTNYKDSNIQTGQNTTYYYVVTAVNSSGEESTDSNQASVLVP